MPPKFITRAYNRFEIDHKNQIITKVSKEERLNQEAKYYKNIPCCWEQFFPRYIESGKRPNDDYYLKLELFAYDDLGTTYLNHRVDNSHFSKRNAFWAMVAKQLHNVLNDFQGGFIGAENLPEMYKEKTEREYENLIKNFPTFKNICAHEKLKINDVDYDNFEVVWPKLLAYFNDFLYKNHLPAFIHGDMCFSNILCGQKDDYVCLKLIDPRGKFGNKINYGDGYYDLAKLSHSTGSGYEAIINDKTKVEATGNQTFKVSINTFAGLELKRIHKIFDEEIYSKYDKTKIKLIEGLIYIGMCARHYDSEQRQLYMYLTGIKLLNKALEELEEKR